MLDTILEKWQSHKLLISLGGLGILSVVAILIFHQPTKAEQVPDIVAMANSSSTSQNKVKKDAEEKEIRQESRADVSIMVDVKGAVVKPGLYELEVDDRVANAIKLAGGLTDQADPKSINLAQKLQDEAVVYVATKEEGISLVSQENHQSSTAGETEKSGLVNINKADASQLQTISGIGAKRAQDIIAYREANGLFKSVDDLNQVSGIGDKTLETLRAYVTVD